MNQFNNHNSAFYSGPTRYGGAAAVAKRREAARKAFFAVKEVPTSSSRSNNINGPNLISTYTINNDNIIRREPAVPQLTSHAKKILSWIEESSGAQQETFQICKRNQRTKHRFNPMAYRAPVFKAPNIKAPALIAPAETIIPTLSSPPQLKRIESDSIQASIPTLVKESINEWKPPTLTNELPKKKSLPAVEAPKSSRFPEAVFCGPTEELALLPSKKKVFAAPRDLNPPQDQPKKVIKENNGAKEETFQISKINQPIKESFSPKAYKAPVITAPVITAPVVIASIKAAPFITAPAEKIIPKISSPPQPQFKKTEIDFTQTSIPTLKKSAYEWKPPTIINESPKKKSLPVVEAPKSSRFPEAVFCGPTEEITLVTSQKKVFATPIDLSPPQDQPERPQTIPAPAPTPVLNLAPTLTPTISPISTPTPTPIPASTPTPVQAPAPILSSTPVLATTSLSTLAATPTIGLTSTTAPASTLGSNPITTLASATTPAPVTAPATTPAPVQTSPMLDVEMDIDPPSAVMSPPPPTASVPTTTVATPLPTTVISPILQQSPAPATSVPALVSQPLFMPPPSFATPTFTSPVPPVTTMSMPNGSNPFQPTSSTRGRKILRPARRLHR